MTRIDNGFLTFLIYSLAVFRLSLMLSDDSGPWKLITKFRSWLKREEKKSPQLKKSDVAHGVECLRCNGIWFAALVTVFVYSREHLIDTVAMIGNAVIVGFALSGLAIILNRAFPAK